MPRPVFAQRRYIAYCGVLSTGGPGECYPSELGPVEIGTRYLSHCQAPGAVGGDGLFKERFSVVAFGHPAVADLQLIITGLLVLNARRSCATQ
jgi:hypothetical protein